MKYRSKLQIIAEILDVVKSGARKTHIMYKANLSYKLLCKYLDEALDCGFVQTNRENGYVVAPKGEKLLKRLHRYMERSEHVKKEMREVDEERALLENMTTSLKTNRSRKTKKSIKY
ncbi:MAG: hypothetical protein JSV51_05500 [Candidatus Bathyarchaeota archaeon]|nr:MAG: hypothetical protein JSV51_05500 [Candidatus Bathyarchaeota archaeon]